MSALSRNSKDEYSSRTRKEEISAEEISKTLDKFGSAPPYEFQTRASRRRDDNMVDPLSAKLGEFDINDPANMTTNESIDGQNELNNANLYVPAATKEILECEWQSLFGTAYYKNELRNRALTGRLRDCRRFRGVCWRVFLGCLPDNVTQWLETVCEERSRYDVFKSKYFVDPYSSISNKENVQVFNPLSQDSDNPWSQYFEDKKLNDLILQDLDRLFPGMHYFQSKKIKDILLHILFIYARMNPNVGYKQGMHEVLAPLVFVLEYDSEVFQFLENSDNEVMKYLINPEYLEYDAFSLFHHLMEIIEPWYAQGELPPPSKQTFDPRGLPFMETQPTPPPTVIIRKLNKIQESMLRKYDGVLYNHLRDMKIEPQLYGLRWVRLLYGREFTTMEDILTLWDGLFADGISLDLVDYIYLSLICNKRRKLLSSDHFGCLAVLMKTPYCKRDAKAVVLEAKYMRDTKLDPTKKIPGAFQPKQGPNSVVPPEFSRQIEGVQSKISSGLQTVLRGARHIPSKKGPEINSRNTTQTKKPEKMKESHGDDKRRPVELKANNKLAPSHHMFPHDPDDEDLFMTSPRSRASSATFLSKLSSKVRNPGRTDLTTLQQDHERLQEQVSHFKAEVDKLHSISIYCGTKMDSYINLLQEQITCGEQSMDVVYLSIAGLKQVRDLLKGTLSFQSSTMEEDTEFSHIDTAISSLTQNNKAIRTSTQNELPGSLPVPLLADYGHFEKHNEKCILVESNDDFTDDVKMLSSSSGGNIVGATSDTSENVSHLDNEKKTKRDIEGDDEFKRDTDEQLSTENVINIETT